MLIWCAENIFFIIINVENTELRTVVLLNILVETIIYFPYILWYIESKNKQTCEIQTFCNINNVLLQI